MTAHDLLASDFAQRKRLNPNFSLRAYAKWLGLSPAQVSQMISGRRPITSATFGKIASKLGLSPLEKNLWLEQREPTAERQRVHLGEDNFRLISDWHHLAILGLTKVKGAKGDARWVARRLGLPVAEVNEAMSRMVRMGILEVAPALRQLSPPFEATSSIPSEAIRSYHRQSLRLALEKLDLLPNHRREFQSVTLALREPQLKTFRRLIDRFLNEASELADAGGEGEQVFHLNVQLFPVTSEEPKS